MLDSSRPARLARAWDALIGLSVGDALGAMHFVPGARPGDLDPDRLPPPPWHWTDDTEMACTVVDRLAADDRIDQDALARNFAERYQPHRDYGPNAVVLLRRIRDGAPWRAAAGALFGGLGSCGNCSAMRVAPLGAYFADDPDRAAHEATRAAEVTHRHPEGVAGAVAVALAAAHAARGTGNLLGAVAAAMPAVEVRADDVRAGLAQAARLDPDTDPVAAAGVLGNGAQLLCQDTVPFAVWVAARYGTDYPGAIRACIAAGGDVDTMSAIVGGIVAAAAGAAAVPDDWRQAREPLPAWLAAPPPAGPAAP